jgi:hypothetical protein
MKMDWWKNGLHINFHVRPLGLAIALVYALAYWASREVSFDQFHLPTGIRVAALLLCPLRLWPYLLVGEYCYFGFARYPMIDKYGLAWVVLGSSFLMPSVMLIVYLLRRLMDTKTDVWLICVAAASAITVTTLSLLLPYLLWTTPPAAGIRTDAVRFLVGDFIGILTIAPLALLWMKRREYSPLTSYLLLPTVACLVLMGLLGVAVLWFPADAGAGKTNMLLLLSLPAVALTCMHGWRGAAISVPIWSLIVRLTMPASGVADSFDPAAFSAQQSLAVVGIALLTVGSFLSHYRQQFKEREVDEMKVLSHSRASHIANEMALRRRALDIRTLGDGLDTSLSGLADWLTAEGHRDLATSLLNVTVVHSRKFREQVSMVYPTSLEHVGLYLALQIGGISEAWKVPQRFAEHCLIGDPCRLSLGLQLAAYRTVIEAASLLLDHEPGQLQIRARCGQSRAGKGIVISVGTLDRRHTLSESTMAMAIERLTGRTLAYGGTVQCRGNRIRMLLVEAVDGEEWCEQPKISGSVGRVRASGGM